jgi:hypothetical protein
MGRKKPFSREETPPDLGCALLHQKLQVRV